jgi:hypothetical protein
MAARKSLLGPPPSHPELEQLLERARSVPITEEQLEEQRVSFAFGNAPEASRISKQSIRDASRSILLPK